MDYEAGMLRQWLSDLKKLFNIVKEKQKCQAESFSVFLSMAIPLSLQGHMFAWGLPHPSFSTSEKEMFFIQEVLSQVYNIYN